ncbi:MAG: signal peptidase I [Pseudoxanthomonas sp.]
MNKLRRWTVRLLLALAVAIPLAALGMYWINPFGARSYDPRQRLLGYSPYRVPSRSMSPTIEPGQIVIASAGYYHKHSPERGDIVIFLVSDGNSWIKRVVGLPGERIAIDHGVVRIDGHELDEDYLDPGNVVTGYSLEMPMQEVPENSYFLLGDNRDNSEDARLLGATPRDDLTGKVVAIFE